MTREPKSKRGADRQWRAIMRQCRRDMVGGLTFGIDWPTLRSVFPARYARLRHLAAIYPSLPD